MQSTLALLVFVAVATAHMHGPRCPKGQFDNDGVCAPCNAACKGGGCSGPGPDECLFVCPVFRESPEPLLLFPSGLKIRDDDHNQVYKMESAEFIVEDLEEYGDAEYVTLEADVNGTNINQRYYRAEGKLVLTGSDYVSAYEKVFKTISFLNSAPTPPNANRFVAFSVFDGDTWSREYAVEVTTTLVNNHAPVVRVAGNTQKYVEHHRPLRVFDSVDITDADHPNMFLMEEAMIWVDGNFSDPCFGRQFLSVELGDNRQVQVVSGIPAQMIHLRGNASIDAYAQIFRTALFRTMGVEGEPPRGSATIRVRVFDGKFAGEASVTLSMETVNDSPPRIEGVPPSEEPVFSPDEGKVKVAEMVVLDDCDDMNVHMWTRVDAEILTQTSDSMDEFLEVNTGSVASISVSANSSQRHLILVPSGEGSSAPVKDFERVLRTLEYENRNEFISCPARRAIRLSAWDGIFTVKKETTVYIQRKDQFKPVLSVVPTGHVFDEDGVAVRLISRAEMTDRDLACGALLVVVGAEIKVTAPDGANEMIEFALGETNVTMAGRTDNADGTFTVRLSGRADARSYATVLESIMYRNLADEPDLRKRTVWITIIDEEFRGLAPVSLDVEIVSRNDKRVTLEYSQNSFTFTENGEPVSFQDIRLTDADSDPDDRTANVIEVWVSDPPNGPFDENILVNASMASEGISIERIASSRVKIRGGDDSDSLWKFNRVLQTLSYVNANPEPIPGRRTIVFKVSSNALPPANDMEVDFFIDVVGVNDSPTSLKVSSTVDYTEGSSPIPLVPGAVAVDNDLQPVEVPLSRLEVVLMGNEPGAVLGCAGCGASGDVTVNVAPNAITATCDSCDSSTIVAVAREVTFVIERSEPPRLAAQVRVEFKITDRDGLEGATYATVRVIRVCNPGRFVLNAGDASTTAIVQFDEKRPTEWVPLVAGPVAIKNDDSEMIVEVEISISENFDRGHDELDVGNANANFELISTSTGLRVVGMQTLVDAAKFVETIRFRNAYECRVVASRTITIRLLDDCGAWTNYGVVTVVIVPSNDPPIVYPQSGSRQPLWQEYAIEGFANADPSPLRVFPRFDVRECDGPMQGFLSKVDVTLTNAPDLPRESLSVNETLLNAAGLRMSVVEVDDDSVRYDIRHSSGSAVPANVFVSLIRSLVYVNSATRPYEVTRRIVVAVSDVGGAAGEGAANVRYSRDPIRPTLTWNERMPLTWMSRSLDLLNRDDFSLVSGDVPFMHKALINVTNPIQRSPSDNFKDIVYIDDADASFVESFGIRRSPNVKGAELVLEYDGPVSNVDASQFAEILRKVKFDSFDPQKNCDRRISVEVWDSPLKRPSNAITVRVIVGRGREPRWCGPEEPTTEEPTTEEPTTEEPTTEEPTTEEPTTEEPTEGLVSCGSSSFVVRAQSDVDWLENRACDVINGDLTISCNRMRSNCFDNFVLTGLSQIKVVTGALKILDNRMSDLSGLENVRSFASLQIRDNTELLTTEHLRKNTHAMFRLDVVDVRVSNNQRLTDLHGLKGIESVVDYVRIESMSRRQELNIDGLESLVSVGGLLFFNNLALGSMASLSQLTTVGGPLSITNVFSLSTLDGLDGVTSVGAINIRNMDLLTFGNGLGSLDTVTGEYHYSGYSVVIFGNKKLTDTSDFPSDDISVDGGVLVRNNRELCGSENALSTSFWGETGAGTVRIRSNGKCRRR